MRKSVSGVGRFSLVSLLVVCLTLVLLPLSSAEDAKTGGSTAASDPTAAAPASPQPKPPAKPVTLAQPKPAAVNAVTQAAVQAGVLTCVSRINQVVTFLTANVNSAAFLFLPQRQPDQSMFSVSLGLENDKATTRYASASFAPTTSGQVSAVYDSIEYVAQSVADVETKILKNLKRKGTMGKDIVILDAGPVTVFLMPAGSGCVVIKKEVVQ